MKPVSFQRTLYVHCSIIHFSDNNDIVCVTKRVVDPISLGSTLHFIRAYIYIYIYIGLS